MTHKRGQLSLLLGLFVLVQLASSRPAGAADSAEQQLAPTLMALCQKLRDPAVPNPSAQQVLDGYKEYVQLHKIQSKAADVFSGADGQTHKVDEAGYEQVAELLANEEVQIVADSLFVAFDDYEPEQEIKLTPGLAGKILKAIDETYQ